jgi:hypothetical protein
MNKEFFGTKEYVGVEDTGNKTPSGVAIIKVLFEDGTSQVTTQTVFDLIKASVAVDLTQQRELLIIPLVQKIFSLMTDFNVKNDDVQVLFDRLINTYNTTLNHATNYLFNVEHIGNLGMLRINEVNERAESDKKQA